MCGGHCAACFGYSTALRCRRFQPLFVTRSVVCLGICSFICFFAPFSCSATVEFPAVLLNTATGDIESEFHTYVQPQEHPILSEFCTELTGITQVVTAAEQDFTLRSLLLALLCRGFQSSVENSAGKEWQCILTHAHFCFIKDQVDGGVPLHICLSQFLKWIEKIQKEKKIIFSTGTPSSSSSAAKACTFVTWTGKYNCHLPFLHSSTY